MGGGERNTKSTTAGGWWAPPAMLRDPGETLDGEHLLYESDGNRGLLLWRTSRDVALWAGTPPGERMHLFVDESAEAWGPQLAAAELPPATAAAIDTIHALLTLTDAADVSVLSICCLEVAEWAGREGLRYTAVAFAQAAALAATNSAQAAVHTGIFASVSGQDARAETWLRRAIGLARAGKDGEAYSAALVELGVVYEARGDLARAETFYRKGYWAGRRFSSWRARLRGAYGLFRLARRRGADEEAAEFALIAQGAYHPEVEGGPDLLLDLAQFWIRTRDYRRARDALRRLSPTRGRLSADGRLLTAALAARVHVPVLDGRTVGGLAAAEAWELMQDGAVSDETRFAAAWHLAHAGWIAGDLEAFARAKRALLTLAPRDAYGSVVTLLADLWPEDGSGPASLGWMS